MRNLIIKMIKILSKPFVGYNQKICVCSGLLILLLSKSAIAGPPFVTDDPEPVAEHTWEVNYAISSTRASNDVSAAIPSIDINYGLSESIQLHAQPRYSYDSNGSSHNFGFDNTEIGVKYRFIHQKQNDNEKMLGIYPMLQLPTGNSKLGDASGKTQLFLPIWAQLNTEKWTVYGGGGYRLNNFRDSKNSWFVGVTTLYEVTNKLKLGAEIFHETATAQGQSNTSGFNLGGTYNLVDSYGLLFSVGRGLNHIAKTNELSAYLGWQVIY